MTLKTFKSFSFRLIPWNRVCFSTIGNSTVPSQHAEIEEKTSQRHESRVASQSPSENENRFNHDRTKEDEDSANEIHKVVQAQCKWSSKERVLDTIQYLKELGFSNDVILESLPICLFPRSRLEEGFKKIKKNEAKLNQVGLVGGFTQGATNDFQHGSHLPDKRLQLCMYYLGEPLHFRDFEKFFKRRNVKKKQ